MGLSPEYRHGIMGTGAGLLSGFLFSFLAGAFDPARYLIEQLTLIPFEVIFASVAVLVTRRFGFMAGILYVLGGFVGAVFPFFPEINTTAGVFVKTAATGVLIAQSFRFGASFAGRLATVTAPGLILAVFLGIPLIYHGMPADTLEEIRRESLEMYQLFMSPEDAANTAENAMALVNGMLGIGLSILVLSSLVVSWFSFLFSGWLLRRSGQMMQRLPAVSDFTVPFPVMWVFLASFALVLSEAETLFPVVLNVLVITAGLYGIQGVAVIMHFMNRASMGRFPRVIFWLVFFITLAFSGIIFVFTGIIDNWFHLRSAATVSGVGGGNEGTDDEDNSER